MILLSYVATKVVFFGKIRLRNKITLPQYQAG